MRNTLEKNEIMRKQHPYMIKETQQMPTCRNLRQHKENTYQKEQKEYIQGKINKIRNSVKDRPSWIAWQTVNEVSKRKSTLRPKLKAASQEQIHKWKEHFKNLLGNSPKVTDNPSTKIITCQLDINKDCLLKKNSK